MKKKTIWIILFALAALWQGGVTIIAERSGEYDVAIYEMLWLFLFVFLLYREMDS